MSYCWANKIFADKIDIAFQPTGVVIKRDIREIGYKDSIKDYMRQVRSTDFVLLIISDEFLKSASAMFEVLEVLKDVNFKDKILPIIIDDTKIYKPEDQIAYIKYWTERHDNLKLEIDSLKSTDAIDLIKELRHYENVKSSIGEFLSHISSIQNATFSELESTNFQKIFQYLGVSEGIMINEILALGELSSLESRDMAIERLQEKYPRNAKIFFAKGYYAYEDEQFEKSTFFYRKAIEYDPALGAAYFNLAFNMDVQSQSYDEAKDCYLKAIEIDPKNTKAYTNLAILYATKLDNPKEGVRILESAIRVNQYEKGVYYNLAVILQRDLKDYQEAIKNYQKALQIDKWYVEAMHNFGWSLWKLKKYAEAQQQFLNVLEIDPYNKHSLIGLAELLETEYKHIKTAKVYYDKFIQVQPNTASDHYSYASFLMLHYLPSYKELARKHYELACSMDSSLKSEHVEKLLE